MQPEIQQDEEKIRKKCGRAWPYYEDRVLADLMYYPYPCRAVPALFGGKGKTGGLVSGRRQAGGQARGQAFQDNP